MNPLWFEYIKRLSHEKIYYLLVKIINKRSKNLHSIENLDFETTEIIDPSTFYEGIDEDFLVRYENRNSILEIIKYPEDTNILYEVIPIIGKIDMNGALTKNRSFIMDDIPDNINISRIRKDRFFLFTLKNKQIFAAVFMEPTNFGTSNMSIVDIEEIKKIIQDKLSSDSDVFIYDSVLYDCRYITSD